MDSPTLITSIVIASFSIILLPICIYGCRKCALYIIDDEVNNIVFEVRNRNNHNDDDNIIGKRERRSRERNVLNNLVIKVRLGIF